MRGLASSVRATMAKRLVLSLAAAAPASTRTIVEPSADTPTGTGSRPIVGRRHAPSISRRLPQALKPRSALTSSTRVIESSGTVTTMLAQSLSGAPSGKPAISSSVLERITWRRSSPGRPTTSHASVGSYASSGIGVTVAGFAEAVGLAGAAGDGAGAVDVAPVHAASIEAVARIRTGRRRRSVVDISSPGCGAPSHSIAHPSYTGRRDEVPRRAQSSVSARRMAASRPRDVSRRKVTSPSDHSRVSPTQRR